MTTTHRAEVGNRALRDTLGLFATGITVITTGRSEPHGMTANAFTSVSIDPPLLLVCVRRDAAMHESIVQSGSFAVSLLAADQEDLARHFADNTRPYGASEFANINWFPGHRTGVPIVSGSLAWLECRLTEAYAGGDHTIFLGTVLDSGHGAARNPLIFYGGRFHPLTK